MQELRKVNIVQLFEIWKNVSLGLFTIIVVIISCKFLPFYLAPVIGLMGAAFLFTLLYNNKLRGGYGCMVIPYAFFFNLIAYSFVSILANVLYIWGLWALPDAFVFFNDPYIPTLWMNPIAFITLLVVTLNRRNLRVCVDCRLKNGSHSDRGVWGHILNAETKFQLKNLTILAGVLTVIVWGYYIFKYQDINTNAKDRYIFFWITVIGLALDEIYFLYRYYNLYLDLKESNELMMPEELQELTSKTYLRFYVICGNDMYLMLKAEDPNYPGKPVIDTPFFTHRGVESINNVEVKEIISEMTGVKDGELKFFFGRRMPELEEQSLLRYFYFLPGNAADYGELKTPGEWLDFELVKQIYSMHPTEFDAMMLNDISRMATIMVTRKIFNENGFRKMKIKSYTPTFDLNELRESDLDFQDDKWIRISLFNSDTRFYRIKRWYRRLTGGVNGYGK